MEKSYACTYSKLISFDTSAGGGQDAEKAHLSAFAESRAEAKVRPSIIQGGKLK